MGELKEYRKLSDNELTYIKFKNIVNPYFQIAIECEKNGVDINEVEKALRKLSLYSEYFNLIIKKNKFYFTKREIKLNIINEVIDFDGINIDKIELFSRKMIDNFMDIYYFQTTKNDYLLFKANHSYVDGQGLLYIIKLLISIIKEEVVDMEIDYIPDTEYVKKLETTKFNEHLNYSNKIENLGDFSNKNRVIVKRIKIEKNTNAILPKIIKVISSYYSNENQTYIIPSSIRDREEKKSYISNLSLPLYLRINKNDEWNEIYLKMYKNLKEKKNLNVKNLRYGMVLKVSNVVFKYMINTSKFIQKKIGKFFTCGSLTNMGIINLNKYNSDKLKINRMFNIPFFQPLLPLIITIMENSNGIDIVFATNSNTISEENVNKIIKQIEETLEK